MATANPTFLSLPQELRDAIYRHLLVKDVSIKCCPVRYNRATKEPPMVVLPTEILRVSREIHDEAQEIMPKENTFITDCRGKDFDHHGARDLHSQEVLKQASNLRMIVDDDVQGMWRVAKFLEVHTCLRSLHLEFRLNATAYFGLTEFGEAWLEPLNNALRVLRKVGVRDVFVVINSTEALECGKILWGVDMGMKCSVGFQVMEKFTKDLKTEMRKNYSG